MEHHIETSKEIEVGGYRYLVSHPQVETAWEIGVELVKMLGGSAASMADVGDKGEKVGEALARAVTLFLQKVDAKTSMLLMKKILANVEVQGEVGGNNKKFMLNEAGLKTHFHGRIGSMMRLTSECIAFTHADFFDAIADGVAAMMKKASDKIAA
jgi:hypothetical protein